MSERIVVIGGGGFGREVLDLVEAVNAGLGSGAGGPAGSSGGFEVVGVLDDGSPDASLLAPYDVAHLGPVRRLQELPEDVGYVIGIRESQARRAIDQAQRRGTRSCPVLVHPSATTGRQVELGPGTLLFAGARLTNHVTLGRHVHVNLNCTVSHDAVLEDYVSLSPQVAVSDRTHLKHGCFLGTGATVNPGGTVGHDAVVGSGGVVLKDIPAGVRAVGVPAKPRPLVS